MPEDFDIRPADARRLVLLHQGIHKERQFGRGKNAALRAIETLGYVQIDTISVVERAHHHVFWSRAPGYKLAHLDALIQDKTVFEYWSHAAAFLPMRDFRFSLPRKHAIQGGEKHWFDVGPKALGSVLERVQQEGPLQSKDFDSSDKLKTGWGEFKIAKRALEQLFMRGELMISKRVGFQKVYDLPERVLPNGVDTSTPTEEEFLDHLILGFIDAQGLAQPSECGHLRKGIKPKLKNRCEELHEDGELVQLNLNGAHYYARPNFEQTLKLPLSRQKVKILSPFDNLVIQRDRLKNLFGFDYQIECYVTEKKRKHGYFVLPILWGHDFAGRLDAKVDRKSKQLTVHKLFVETPRSKEFLQALEQALQEFAEFTGAETVTIAETILN